jgi:hypothetical protein
VDQGIKGEKVVEVLDRIVTERGAEIDLCGPQSRIRFESTGSLGVRTKSTLDFSCSDKPADNAYVETFNGRRSKVSASFLFSRLCNWILKSGLKVSWWARGRSSSNPAKVVTLSAGSVKLN